MRNPMLIGLFMLSSLAHSYLLYVAIAVHISTLHANLKLDIAEIPVFLV